ncbi:MAG: hypothetical protein ACJ8AO_02245 [Gemmatimonadaceae bacterium]
MMLFTNVTQLQSAVALGALETGSCVYVAAELLRALGAEGTARLARDLAAVGARLVAANAPDPVVVYTPADQRPPDC